MLQGPSSHRLHATDRSRQSEHKLLRRAALSFSVEEWGALRELIYEAADGRVADLLIDVILRRVAELHEEKPEFAATLENPLA
jgi:hypothetical protein